MQNDKKNGRGVMQFANGNLYDGEWKDDDRHGKGVHYWKDFSKYHGDRYDGEWVEGKFNGKGVYYFASGNKYDGELKNDKRHGKGV